MWSHFGANTSAELTHISLRVSTPSELDRRPIISVFLVGYHYLNQTTKRSPISHLGTRLISITDSNYRCDCKCLYAFVCISVCLFLVTLYIYRYKLYIFLSFCLLFIFRMALLFFVWRHFGRFTFIFRSVVDSDFSHCPFYSGCPLK